MRPGKFRQEPYQTSIKRPFWIDLQRMSQKKGFMESLKFGLFDTALKHSKVVFGPVSSGSAVVADAKKMTEIGMQHRKWSALDMEMYSMQKAAFNP